METDIEIIVIGAGMAGLTAARILKSYNRKILVIEAADEVGGRMRTDLVDGYLLDRGFQVLLTAYPEAQRFLDYERLDLKPFAAGTAVYNENWMTQISDPLRNPRQLFKTLFSPVGTLLDKLRLMKLRWDMQASSVMDIFARPETTTQKYLENVGFSRKMIERFFKPFFSGIFLEPQLQTSSRMFEFVFKMMSDGDTAVPANGMGMIPKQLASILTADELLLNEKVMQITDNEVITYSGQSFKAKAILIATGPDNMPFPFKSSSKQYKHASTIYFSAPKTIISRATLSLNASQYKLVNNIAFMDQVSAAYAPTGRSLISVSLTGDFQHTDQHELVARVLSELKQWYPNAKNWQYLKTYHIPHALPPDNHVSNEASRESMKIGHNQYICGGYLRNGSINGAMKSGRLAAELIMREIA